MPVTEKKKKTRRRLVNLKVNEVSICASPANQNSWISFAKAVDSEPGGGKPMPENKDAKTQEEQLQAMQKQLDELTEAKKEADENLAKVQEELATRKAEDEFTDEQRKYFDGLGDKEKSAFRKASAEERDTLMDMDETIVTPKGLIRKSNTDPEVFAMFKAQEAKTASMEKQLQDLIQDKEVKDITKELEEKCGGRIPVEKPEAFVTMYKSADDEGKAVLDQFLAQATKGQQAISGMVYGYGQVAKDGDESTTDEIKSMREMAKKQFANTPSAKGLRNTITQTAQ